ncbi:protein TolR [Marinobacter nanhaiticus D15-8W]|uniref:Tol-Pal system protein TolR n=1 Tax=Marinobacter nanhaiticus D15-8W TaxID=626887 RepID=N6WZY4_9GAMM|nr:protein TolR [Marinobacter nanhaiticus]ENO14358.1 protein TolR [Marinobacter nanhaiticus D15-8W]BES71746.1 protein TolR [Marinobacter nanhaiticus D15-8W]
MKSAGITSVPRRKPMAEINVVPYIDVMLVLLVIFMVTAPMMTQGVKVDLPETTSDPIQAQKDVEPVIVSVDANGAYYMEVGDEESEPMALGDLNQQVSKILAGRSQRDVLVRGDENVDYGTVVRLMATLQTAGATSVGLITEEPQG